MARAAVLGSDMSPPVSLQRNAAITRAGSSGTRSDPASRGPALAPSSSPPPTRPPPPSRVQRHEVGSGEPEARALGETRVHRVGDGSGAAWVAGPGGRLRDDVEVSSAAPGAV